VRSLLLAAVTAVLFQAPPAWLQAQLQSFDVAWQTVNESFYDPEFGGLDWEAVRDEFRPRIERAESAAAARLVIQEMLARLGRSHFGLINSQSSSGVAGPAVAPIDVRVAADGVFVTRVRSAGGSDRERARPGDAILAIDGEPTSALRAQAEGGDARARALDEWRRVDHALRGRRGSTVAVRVRRPDGSEHDVEMERWLPPGELVRLGNLPALRVAIEDREVRSPAGRRVGVIAFNLWMAALNEPIAEAVDRYRQHDGLVIDLRGNPGGLVDMIRGVAGHVLDEPVLLGHLRMRMAPLQLKANPRRSMTDGRSVTPFAGPVAVLVDELTGSASECFAGALQGLGRVRVFGRATMGQALPALTKRLPSGDVLMYVVGDFVTAAERSLEGAGVVPDEVVPFSPELMAAGHDPDLDAALAWLDSAKRARN
jgi:carboxyl-terminal processing protease